MSNYLLFLETFDEDPSGYDIFLWSNFHLFIVSMSKDINHVIFCPLPINNTFFSGTRTCLDTSRSASGAADLSLRLLVDIFAVGVEVPEETKNSIHADQASKADVPVEASQVVNWTLLRIIFTYDNCFCWCFKTFF